MATPHGLIGLRSPAAGLVLCCLALGSALGQSADADVLVDQVVAGCEGNLALIQAGRATYSITTSFADATKPVPKTASLWFDGPRLRIDVGDFRIIQLPDRAMEFPAPHLGTEKQFQPHNYSVIISPPWLHPEAGVVHPRMQGFQVPHDIAAELRAVRGVGDFTVAGTMEGKIIRITEESEANHIKMEMWVDPDQGYGVVRLVKWSRPRNLPAVEVHSKYRRANNGAFVVSECRRVLRKPESDGYHDDVRVDIALQEISLGEKPDEKLFTIEGLGLPEGARIQDRIHDRIYVYGWPTVTEEQVERYEVTGPARKGSWVAWLAGVAAVFGVALLLLRRIRLARRR